MTALHTTVPFGTMGRMVEERRPRIPPELADQIDDLREDTPFEPYVRGVLERHVQHHSRETDERLYRRERKGVRLHTYEDPDGVLLYVDRDDGESHTHEGVLATVVLDDEEYDAVGAYLTEREVRALRDTCTELLEGYSMGSNHG